jgi:non-specific serine/threonine protein kinase
MTVALATHAGHLPAEVTIFVERRRETAELKRLLSWSRLVTLTGPGGVGKTRLAIHGAAQVRRAFPDGISFVDLSVVDDPGLLIETVAGALGVVAFHGMSETAALVEHLEPRHTLLVLDNCEHVLEAASDLTATLLRGCDRIKIVATSREALGIFGESVLPVPAMALPGPDLADVRALSAVESVRLFLNRAIDAYPAFELSAENLAMVGEVCRRLDGLPLAIELAAVRLRVLSLAQILARLTDRYRFLTGGSRDAPGRHRTLRASIEWSYELCSPAEQLMWQRVSVFSGAWELDAAEAVCAGAGVDRGDVLDLLQSLVDKSIVVRGDDETGHACYRMLATIHEFGASQLAQSGQLAQLRRRHRDWCHELLCRADADWIGPRQAYWLGRMYRELPNIRAAIEYCLADPGEQAAALGLTVPAWRVCWWAQGRVDELHEWLDRILPVVGSDAPLRDRAVVVRASMAAIQRRSDVGLAEVAAARERAERAGDAVTVALSWHVEGFASLDHGDPAAAVLLLGKAIDALGDTADLGAQMLMRMMLAIAHAEAGDAERAESAHLRARELARSHGERFELSYLLRNLAVLALGHGDLSRARSLAGDSVRLKRELGDFTGLALGMQTLARVAAARRDYDRAAALLGAAGVLWAESGASDASYPVAVRQREECVAEVRQVLGPRGYERKSAAGGHLSIADAIAFALDEATDGDGHGSMPPAPARLTPRELEIAELVARGLTNRQIAAKLVIAQRTAEGHVERILTKLGFSSRTQIVAWVIEESARPLD